MASSLIKLAEVFDSPLQELQAPKVKKDPALVTALVRRLIKLEKLQLAHFIKRSNIPAIPVRGSFNYNVLEDAATNDLTSKKFYGFDNHVVSFAEVLNKVDSKSKELFVQQAMESAGRFDSFKTNQIQLVNGNIIEEFYRFEYHPEDYERRSLISIAGKSKLLRVA